MGVLSKEQHAIRGFLYKLITNKKTGIPLIGTLIFVLFLSNYRNRKLRKKLIESSHENMSLKNQLKKQRNKKGTLNLETLQNFFTMLKIAMPNLVSLLSLEMLLMIFTLISRTLLSIKIASVNGQLVKAIMSRSLKDFVKKILVMFLIGFPASFLNSYIQYLEKSINYKIRENLTNYFQLKYISNLKFYQIVQLDNRIKNPDQKITQDIDKFAQSFAKLYTNMTKPLLDMILFTKSLSDKVGFKTVSISFFWYGVSALLLKYISPPMGLLTAFQQNFEGDFRAQQSNIKTYSQEIAFLNGNEWERKRLNKKFDIVYRHNKDILNKRLFLGVFDSLLTKYGATMIGYFILAKPTMHFFQAKKQQGSITNITANYIRNGSLMVNLAKAIGRIVISYKDFQKIMGYTTLLVEFKNVLDDLEEGKYARIVEDKKNKSNGDDNQPIISKSDIKGRGKIFISDDNSIKFEDVTIITPNEHVLVENISFILKRGQNLIISGPNGCGKSSLFRVLGNLWPLICGSIRRPKIENLFYLPQRPYLSEGTLIDQILYPSTDKKPNIDEIIKNLKFVKLDNLINFENPLKSLSQKKDWKKELSEGEKQRIAMARLLYHKPFFAILDECSSRVSSAMEANFYKKTKELGISLFTIAHRPSLFKYHDFCLKIHKGINWEMVELTEEKLKEIEEGHVQEGEDSEEVSDE